MGGERHRFAHKHVVEEWRESERKRNDTHTEQRVLDVMSFPLKTPRSPPARSLMRFHRTCLHQLFLIALSSQNNSSSGSLGRLDVCADLSLHISPFHLWRTSINN